MSLRRTALPPREELAVKDRFYHVLSAGAVTNVKGTHDDEALLLALDKKIRELDEEKKAPALALNKKTKKEYVDFTELPHDIDIDSDKEYIRYGGRERGVLCRRCGQISWGTVMQPTWIDNGPVDREAKCYNSKLPLPL